MVHIDGLQVALPNKLLMCIFWWDFVKQLYNQIQGVTYRWTAWRMGMSVRVTVVERVRGVGGMTGSVGPRESSSPWRRDRFNSGAWSGTISHFLLSSHFLNRGVSLFAHLYPLGHVADSSVFCNEINYWILSICSLLPKCSIAYDIIYQKY